MVRASGMEPFTTPSHKLVDDLAVTDVSPAAAANLNPADEVDVSPSPSENADHISVSSGSILSPSEDLWISTIPAEQYSQYILSPCYLET
ncbi:hypothetical protein H0H87_008692 [Tephrocybe sp. NHM501043]|nr:hypothetical protein H0H87_008692 [Tephrocybe sp. NHM501043]